jgi:hypothetical protein
MLTYEVDTDHLAECDQPIAACPLCADFYGLTPHEVHPPRKDV